MKLLRFGAPGGERPGVQLADGTRIDASAATRDYDEAFFAGDGLRALSQWLARPARALRAFPPARASGRRWRGRARSSASG